MTTNVSNTDQDERPTAGIEIDVAEANDTEAAEVEEDAAGPVTPGSGKPIVKPENWTNG